MQSTTEESEWKTSIGFYQKDKILISGYSIKDLIKNLDFGSAVYLVLKGDLPSKNQAKMVNALLVSTIDHGLSPSEVVTRYIAAAGSPVQASIAGGLLMFGDVHGGAMQQMAKDLQEEVKKLYGASIDDRAAEIVENHRRQKTHLNGFGHPDHPQGDPRVPILLNLAKKLGIVSDHTALMLALRHSLAQTLGRRVEINIDGAFGAILSDLGFDWRVARGFIMISRSAGLLAHHYEELVREKPWRRGPRFIYTGPQPRRLPAKNRKRILSKKGNENET